MTQDEKQQLQETINKMYEVSNTFYRGAIGTGNHAFIEFCGLMNEYIKICQMSLDAGIDFTKTNIHCGKSLVFAKHNKDYLLEKLECIYGTSLAGVLQSGLNKQGTIMNTEETNIE